MRSTEIRIHIFVVFHGHLAANESPARSLGAVSACQHMLRHRAPSLDQLSYQRGCFKRFSEKRVLSQNRHVGQ